MTMRSMVRWEPLATLARLDRELDEIVRGMPPAHRGDAAGGFVPAVDILDEGADVVLRVDLPGIDADRDLELSVRRGRLTLAGRRQPAVLAPLSDQPSVDAGADTSPNGEPAATRAAAEAATGTKEAAATGRVTLSEIRHGAFCRTFVLPDHVTGDDVEASYDRGILTIRIRNVVQPAPQPRRITVTSSR